MTEFFHALELEAVLHELRRIVRNIRNPLFTDDIGHYAGITLQDLRSHAERVQMRDAAEREALLLVLTLLQCSPAQVFGR